MYTTNNPANKLKGLEHVNTSGNKTNFQTLLRAATNDNLALLETALTDSGEPCYVLTAVGYDNDTKEYVLSRFGEMCSDENPYDKYTPPA